MTHDALMLSLVRDAVKALADGLGVEWLHDEEGRLLGFQATFLTAEAQERALRSPAAPTS